MLGKKFSMGELTDGSIMLATGRMLGKINNDPLISKLINIGYEGYCITNLNFESKNCIVIAANSEIGLLYGSFHLLRNIQTGQSIDNIDICETPLIKYRLLNHWDNLDRTVERGYAGFSLWDWHKLPDYLSPRYKDYARANASIGINGTVLTNVNANASVLTSEYLEKVKALANVFRPYGIKVYLTARFSAPAEIGGLKNSDPLNPEVIEWWNKKAKEICSYVPDFGGFLVKANSEGQPGPQNFNRTHADGANLLARAVAPFGGIVMWRAFVYSNEVPEDRAKQAFNEFKPLDGKFEKNVLVQVKNGPIDFQPREPFHPLFGAMPHTPLIMEFQITQEYLGFATHLCYLAPLYKEVLDADTYSQGKGSTVGKVIDGSLEGHEISGMAGVSNIGNDRNWCGGHFAQANWYAYGRLAWNYNLSSESIADEWIRLTFGNNKSFIDQVKEMMMASREIVVDYMTPLGLHHIMGYGHHHGPGPWVNKGRADWTSVYYHKASQDGIGFDRTPSGSNATSQYAPEVADMFNDLSKIPERYLLWFHHLSWDYRMNNGHTLWENICNKYYQGVDSVKWMLNIWQSLKGRIDDERFTDTEAFLKIQLKEAIWWRNACVLYFQSYSKRSISKGLELPEGTLESYMKFKKSYVP
jgi:alpha-glucuronidase